MTIPKKYIQNMKVHLVTWTYGIISSRIRLTKILYLAPSYKAISLFDLIVNNTVIVDFRFSGISLKKAIILLESKKL